MVSKMLLKTVFSESGGVLESTASMAAHCAGCRVRYRGGCDGLLLCVITLESQVQSEITLRRIALAKEEDEAEDDIPSVLK